MGIGFFSLFLAINTSSNFRQLFGINILEQHHNHSLEVFKMFWTANAAQSAGRSNSQLRWEAEKEMAEFRREQSIFLKRQQAEKAAKKPAAK